MSRKATCRTATSACRSPLADGTKLDGTIVWVNGSVAGVRFGIYLLDVDDFLSFEHLGYSWYSSLIRLQRKRQGVSED